ncbi:hypothetical protein DSM106972_097350 [Dulcicalothrix desertica PCC 7102]|uniref:Leucine rich repeat variant domain-containing protein n=1 Tax=Dulcicalothrix desertica PCC 7102 TaxID=232991 RepID=A0A3S1A4C1_9CYAN|nr:hypothetical protein [Dulcicalothrix desertica]RUS93141.1 hypothetical protein DSM106972_097350 [Dulcicalothrix desertica PCC 7102]TWH62791.1 hypothetical protein CAL7102_00319 [Dulcicalothrix desertica PCC 7102]
MLNSPIDQAADINTHPDILRDLADESIELARVVAKNPSTPPDVLEALSGYDHDPEIQRNVTANPNTPVEELITLGADFPYELINNPVFPLLVLENPCFFQELPFDVIESVLLLDDIPEEYLVMAASLDSYEISNLIANHKKVPFHVLSQIVNNPKREKEAYIASQHVTFAGEITEGWNEEIWRAINKYTFLNRIKEKEEFLYNAGVLDERLMLGLTPYSLLNIVYNPDTPSDIAELIINSFFPEVQAQRNLNIASNPNTPINTLIEFSDAKENQLLISVASNPSSPVFVLEKLANMDNQEIKQAIYRNYNTPNSVLKILYQIDDTKENEESIQNLKDSIMKIIQYYQKYQTALYLNDLDINNIGKLLLLSNNIDDLIWKRLENLTSFDVLIALARHPKTPVHILKHIHLQSKYYKSNYPKTKSIKKTLRILLARNPQTSINILLHLIRDDSFQVYSEAIMNLKTNFALYNQQVAHFLDKWEQANNQEAPPNTLHDIVNTRSIALCLAVANNPNASAETLHKLAFHPNHDVLTAVTKHQNTSVETLLTLSRKRKKGYSNIRAHAIKALIQKEPNSSGAVLAEIVSSNEPTSPRFIFLLHPLAPPEFLAQHASSICWIERYAVAQNPSTPAHVISELAVDANRLVRAVAYQRLQTL